MTIRAAAAACCLGLALVGCSADAEPPPLPPAPFVSSTPATLPVPPEATPETAVAAAAFARYYIEVLEAALSNGDATQLRELSDSGCGGCRNLIGAVEDAAAKKHEVRGAGFSVQFAESPPVEQGEVIVELRYERAAGELVDESGAVVNPIAPEGPIDAQMRLRRQTDGWTVLGFRQAPA